MRARIKVTSKMVITQKVKQKSRGPVTFNYEHISELHKSLKLPRSQFGSTKCAQVDHMMQVKKQIKQTTLRV